MCGCPLCNHSECWNIEWPTQAFGSLCHGSGLCSIISRGLGSLNRPFEDGDIATNRSPLCEVVPALVHCLMILDRIVGSDDSVRVGNAILCLERLVVLDEVVDSCAKIDRTVLTSKLFDTFPAEV